MLSQEGSSDTVDMTGADVVARTWIIPGGMLGRHGAFSLDLLLDVSGCASALEAKLFVNGRRVFRQTIGAGSSWARPS